MALKRKSKRAKTKLTARRSLSQNFLIDGEIADRMAAALPIRAGDSVYEIGAGKGFLTERLVATGAECRLIEKDRRMIGMLRKKFKRDANVQIFHADILSLPTAAEPPDNCWLIGNLPFGIGHAILEWILSKHDTWRGAVVTLQREVIRRLLAGPGERGRGSLSVWFQIRATGTALFEIPPNAFHPPPRVTSTVMAVDFVPQTQIDDPTGLDVILQAAFAQPRKILANNLAAVTGLPAEVQVRLKADCADLLNRRAQELHVTDFVRLAKAISYS